MVSLLEQINTTLGSWYVAIKMVNVIFPTPIKKEDQNLHEVGNSI